MSVFHQSRVGPDRASRVGSREPRGYPAATGGLSASAFANHNATGGQVASGARTCGVSRGMPLARALCLCLFATTVSLTSWGCTSASKSDAMAGASKDEIATLIRAQDAYRRGDHGVALAEAQALSDGWSPLREEAAYVAGKAARKLHDPVSAETQFRRASRSSDEELAGQAWAELGLLWEAAGRHRDAERAFREAGARLSGDDLKKANDHLVFNRRKAEGGLTGSRPAGSAPRATTRSRGGGTVRNAFNSGRYALQFGLFSQRTNAEKMLRDVGPSARRAGLGSPRIVPSASASGQRQYYVQAGSFSSRRSAAGYQGRFTQKTIVVPYR